MSCLKIVSANTIKVITAYHCCGVRRVPFAGPNSAPNSSSSEGEEGAVSQPETQHLLEKKGLHAHRKADNKPIRKNRKHDGTTEEHEHWLQKPRASGED